jgi:hydrogenase maturation protease
VKDVSIVGLGNIMKGDLGVGCYLVDALNQEKLGDCIDVSYLAEGYSFLDAYFFETKFGIIVQAAEFGGRPGSVYCWNRRVFLSNVGWFADEYPSFASLARVFGKAEHARRFPEDMLFLWIEPKLTEGLGISPQMHRAIRRAIQIIKLSLFERAFLPAVITNLSFIHQLGVLQITL